MQQQDALLPRDPLNESPDPAFQATSDKLLEAIVVLARLHGVHLSPTHLTDYITDIDKGFSKEDAQQALNDKNFRCAWRRCVISDISPVVCPVLVLPDEGAPYIIAEIDSHFAQVINPSISSSTTSTEALASVEARGLKSVLFAAPPPPVDARGDVVAELQGKRWFWGSVFRFRASFVEAGILSFLINILALGMTVLTMSVYDRVLPNQAYSTLLALSIGAVIALFFEFTARTWRAIVLDHVGRKIDLLIGSLVFRHVMSVRLETQSGQSSGAFAHVIREYESVRDFVTSFTLSVVADIPFMLLFLLVIYYVGGPLAIVPLIAAVVLIAGMLASQFILGPLLNHHLRQSVTRSGLVVETLASMDNIKSLRAESLIARQHDRIAADNATVAMKSRLVSTLLANFSSTVQQLATVAILFWGVHLVGAGQNTSGSLIASVMLLGRVMQPLTSLTMLATRFQQARHALQSLDKIMTRPVERDPSRPHFHRSHWEGALEVADASFKYLPSLPDALVDINLKVNAGERIAIIGRMGSGKSTLLKLLAGMYQPSKGDVMLDGLDMRHIEVADVRKAIRLLTQDVRLMHGTLLENLRLAAPHSSDEAILNAVKLTGVAAFAKRHPLGLNMPVGEGGRMLSGGQRQAVALAQVLLGNAGVLLLDEPTASMDQMSEQMIFKALAQVSRGRTMVLVTHKADLLQLVERLIVIDNGKIVMDGPRDAVLKRLSANDVPAATPAAGGTNALPKKAGA